MEPITKLLDKNLSELRYEETVTLGCFWPLSCRLVILGYSIHVTQAQFVVSSMALFTFILYKSELLQIGTILVVIHCFNQILVTFANFVKFGDCWRAFLNFVFFRYERLQNLLFLVLIRCLLSLFLYCNENSCYFCDFCDICRLFKALLCPFSF